MANTSSTIAVDLKNVTKKFGDFTALDNVSIWAHQVVAKPRY